MGAQIYIALAALCTAELLQDIGDLLYILVSMKPVSNHSPFNASSQDSADAIGIRTDGHQACLRQSAHRCF